MRLSNHRQNTFDRSFSRHGLQPAQALSLLQWIVYTAESSVPCCVVGNTAGHTAFSL